MAEPEDEDAPDPDESDPPDGGIPLAESVEAPAAGLPKGGETAKLANLPQNGGPPRRTPAQQEALIVAIGQLYLLHGNTYAVHRYAGMSKEVLAAQGDRGAPSLGVVKKYITRWLKRLKAEDDRRVQFMRGHYKAQINRRIAVAEREGAFGTVATLQRLLVEMDGCLAPVKHVVEHQGGLDVTSLSDEELLAGMTAAVDRVRAGRPAEPVEEPEEVSDDPDESESD